MKEETVDEADYPDWPNFLNPPVTNHGYLLKRIEDISARLAILEERLNEITK